ncbi:MAG: hypothetical protein AB2793_06325 [Candidatus Thiodiazotropha sp.]
MKELFQVEDDRLYIATVQDVEPILEKVKAEKENHRESKTEALGVKAGTIPKVIILRYMQEMGVSYRDFLMDDVHVRRILMDPDFKRFRVWEGRF